MRKITAIVILSLLPSLTIPAQETKEISKSSNSSSTEEYTKFRFGGYGEMVANFKDYGINRFYGGNDGNPKKNRNTISIPRFVLAFDYKFNSKWILGAEIEFESGGTGTAFELENTENGEYETEVEKGGEVAIEQFHITRLIHRSLNVRAGHIIVPVGLTTHTMNRSISSELHARKVKQAFCLLPGMKMVWKSLVLSEKGMQASITKLWW